MKNRKDIIQQFSTFLSLKNFHKKNNLIWQVDVNLERHITFLVESEPDAKEEYWAHYFLKIIRIPQEELLEVCSQTEEKRNFPISSEKISNSFVKAEKHLCAYLQEACLVAAKKSYQRFKFIQHKYPLEEYFQIANSAVFPPGKILKNFNLEHPQNNIEGYAQTAISRFISNTIYRKDLEAKREKFSNYGLLKDLTKKEIQEALALKGIDRDRINLYCLAWQCLDRVYQPNQKQGSRSLETPSAECFQAIASLYNERCHQLGFVEAPVLKERIQEILEICIQAARDYRTKSFLPLDNCDRLTDDQLTALDNLVQEEEWQQINSLVSNLFLAIPEAGQIMLILWLGLNLTQTEMAEVVKNKYPEVQKQYQVARQLAKYNKILLKTFFTESQKIYPEICLSEDKDIEIIKTSLDECLQSHCQQLCRKVLAKIIKEWQNQGNPIHLQTNKEKIDKNFEHRTLKVAPNRNDMSQILQETFMHQLEMDMGLPTNSLEIASKKLDDFVDEWLKDNFFKNRN
ncbi:sigma-70 family RNA polymerase sigma factor [Scytonema sp. NUACC26]|uniref:sigma-70 family RNA polymerase sigma factor n=1 Tax=Scytonema sp. NUACC26 TaxID=3140176 RepID=UPI0034DBA3DC